ncbi:MAG: hypothetical protein JRD88_08565 [Deltaproteobacteria bacterium]|jgi:hypothetical protein|nr:hypothetical protein [Deltaproteobacteria bacterium]
MKRKFCFETILISLLVLLGFLAACGGGGGGGGGGEVTSIPTSYDGTTSQALITCENAENIVINSWEISTKQDVVEVAMEVSGYLFDSYPDVPPQITSDCGDLSFANVQLQVNQVSETYGTFEGQIDFVNYCVNWEESFDLNGLVTFSGTAQETSEGYVVTMILTFENVQKIVSDKLIYTVTEGTVELDVTLSTDLTVKEKITYNHVLRDESTGKTYWFDDLETIILGEYESELVTSTFIGRFYDHDYGFFEIESEGSLIIPDLDMPSGVLWFYGKESEARLTFDAGETLLEVDQNSDGSMDCSFTDIFPTVASPLAPLSMTVDEPEQNETMPGVEAEKIKQVFNF